MKKLKILCMYRFLRYYNKDESLHMGFLKSIANHPEIELKMFGPYLEDICPELIVFRYRYGLAFDDILKDFDADVILVHNKSRMFWEYNPTQSFKGNEWIPSGWHRTDIPTVVLEEDYFMEENDDWYHNSNVDLILQRHYSQSIRKGKVDKVFFPFSIDSDIFKSNISAVRKNKICFAGALGADYYVHRRNATEMLLKKGLIDVFSNGEKIGKDYLKCLHEYVCHLNGSLIHNTSPAKMVEIMSSGSILLTNENDDLSILFDKGSYVTYKKDYSDLLEKVDKILSDSHFSFFTYAAGVKCINENHTHNIRINQLINILKEKFNI